MPDTMERVTLAGKFNSGVRFSPKCVLRKLRLGDHFDRDIFSAQYPPPPELENSDEMVILPLQVDNLINQSLLFNRSLDGLPDRVTRLRLECRKFDTPISRFPKQMTHLIFRCPRFIRTLDGALESALSLTHWVIHPSCDLPPLTADLSALTSLTSLVVEKGPLNLSTVWCPSIRSIMTDFLMTQTFELVLPHRHPGDWGFHFPLLEKLNLQFSQQVRPFHGLEFATSLVEFILPWNWNTHHLDLRGCGAMRRLILSQVYSWSVDFGVHGLDGHLHFHSYLPPRLIYLHLGERCDHFRILPSSLQKLKISGNHSKDLTTHTQNLDGLKSVLPSQLRHLVLPDLFAGHIWRLPETLITLRLGYRFHHPLPLDHLPSLSLLTLLNPDYSHSLTSPCLSSLSELRVARYPGRNLRHQLSLLPRDVRVIFGH